MNCLGPHSMSEGLSPDLPFLLPQAPGSMGLGWGTLVICAVPHGGEEMAGSPTEGCRSWGQNHNLRAASLGLALCPEPRGFRSQMSQQPRGRAGRAPEKEDVSLPSPPNHSGLQGRRLPGRDQAMGPPRTRLANPPIHPGHGTPAAGMDPLASLLTPGRLRLWFASSLGVGG